MAAESKTPEPESKSEGYEKRDANSRWLFAIIGALLFVVACSQAALFWVKKAYYTRPQRADELANARRSPELAQGAFPRLQISPAVDLKAFRAREDEEMDSSGWINRTTGVVRIPVESAMNLLLQRGFPVRKGTNQSRLGPSPYELQQQRTNATQTETEAPL